MPEDKDNPQHTGQYEEPAYSGEDIPSGPMDIPENIPQEHIAGSSPLSSSPVDKAPKPLILKRLFFLVIFLAATGIIAIAVWKLMPSKSNSNTQAQNTQTQPQANQAADPIKLALGDTGLNKTYASDNLSLQIKYPESWKVTEQDNSVIIKAPAFDVQDNAGNSALTYFKIYIKMGSTETDSKYLGRGFAVAPSEKLVYSDPPAGQRKNTYLTDFALDKTDNFAYFIVQGNFKLAKGDTLGPKFASEPDSFLLTGGFATEKQKDGLETISMPLDTYKQNLAYQTGVEIIKSLQIQ